MTKATEGFVFVNGRGIRKFRGFGIHGDVSGLSPDYRQYKGVIKLPKGCTDGYGRRWVEHDYCYCKNEIFQTRNDAILSLCKDAEVLTKPPGMSWGKWISLIQQMGFSSTQSTAEGILGACLATNSEELKEALNKL